MSWQESPQAVGRRVREHRLRRGWSQALLSRESGVSLRTVKSVERGSAATMTTIGKLAAALGLEVAELAEDPVEGNSAETVPQFLLQQAFPIVADPAIEQLAAEGAFADMQRDYEGAVAKFKSAFDLEGELEVHAQLIVRWATALDNAGDSEQAIRELQPLLVNAKWKALRPRITNWVKYHIAIAKRRVYEKQGAARTRDLDEAQKMLTSLSKADNDALNVSAVYQLGVVHWVRARQTDCGQLRKRAERLFARARKQWQEEGNYREGYVLRRLAEIKERDGELQDAHELLLDANDVFVRFEAERYRLDTRERLRSLLGKAAGLSEAT
ncbi:MAG: helix-turn-helix transcriptional regulator [Planctomycetales bacterium]|nr:helix-turn-helix transcriptional regulator [Planctomycetales bacterium]